MITRRSILTTGLTLVSGVLSGPLSRLGRLSALTAPTSDYRALVCLFLYGGNDSNNLVVPLDGANFTSYAKLRGSLALASSALLPVQTASGLPLGLHPKLVELQTLFQNRSLALVANVGNLVAPTTRQQYLNQQMLPSNLFSHADQQAEWQTSIGQGSSTTGWGGRLVDQLGYLNGPATFPMLLSVSGNALFGVGAHSNPAAVIPGSALGLQGFDKTAPSQARYQAVNELLALDGGASLVQQANTTLKQGLDNATALNLALAGSANLKTQFPKTSLGTQLLQIAKVIQVRAQLGLTRQIFFASLGGFDTHAGELNAHDTLFTQVSQALGAFYQATQELAVEQNVTTFTESDFNRTFQANGNAGSDHAWGGHHLVLGGAVKGGELYGKLPTFELGGADDAGSEGRWIPTTSNDQYSSTLALWFGLSPQLLGAVFPNIGNFPKSNLGFLA